MKKSKSSGSKKKKRDSSNSSKSKRSRERSRSSERKKIRVGKTLPRKTRWDSERTAERNESSRKVSPVQSVEKKEKSSFDPPLQIKDLMNDKERLIEHLFATITGTALQELIPDYLKNRTIEELKKLTFEQLKHMSSGLILHIISGKDPSKYPKPEKPDEKSKPALTVEESSAKSDKTEQQIEGHQPSDEIQPAVYSSQVSCNPDASEGSSSDVLELFATSKEMEDIIEDENQVPIVAEEEIAGELRLPESEAEILELEMRARAIRSLLKARSRALSGLDTNEPQPKK